MGQKECKAERRKQNRLSAAVLILAAALFLCGCRQRGEAEEKVEYPREAVEMIAPAGPGGGYDLTLRSLTQVLRDENLVSVPLPITNRPGGGGRIALEYLEENAGQDNLLSIFSPPLCLIYLNGSTDLNYQENTTPIARLAVDYGCFAVRADSPYQTISQVMEALKEDITSVRVGGTSSYGSMDHIQFLKIAMAAGVQEVKNIRYDGFENGGGAAQLMGGRVDLLSAGISDVVGLLESGDIRVLAVTAPHRLKGEVISSIPTCMEEGISAEFSNWRGLFGPKDMPEQAVAYWQEVIAQVSKSEEWKKTCESYGWDLNYADQEEFIHYLGEVNEEYRQLLRTVGMLRGDM